MKHLNNDKECINNDKEIISKEIIIHEDLKILENDSVEIKFEKTFKKFIKHRIELKKPFTESSKESFEKRLRKLSDNNIQTAIEILDEAMANWWQWIFPIKNNSNFIPKKSNWIWRLD